MENQLIFDYLTITFKNLSADDVLDIVCENFSSKDLIPSNFVLADSGVVTGYNRSLRFLGERYFTINFYEGDSDFVKSVCLQLTGKGCQYVDSFDFATIFTYFKKNEIEYNVTRLDVAFDDFTGFLPKDKFLKAFQDFSNGKPVVSSRSNRDSVSFHNGRFNGKTYSNLYFGSRQSDKMLRFYDKRAEQKAKDIEYWERLELQLRRSSASQFLEHWLDTGDFSSTFADALYSMFRIVSPNMATARHNPDCRWFKQFLESIYMLKTYILRIVENNSSEQLDISSISNNSNRKVFKFFREKKIRTLKDEFDSMILNLFKQYGRSISFIRKFEPELFESIVKEYDSLIFDRNKYRILRDNLYSDCNIDCAI